METFGIETIKEKLKHIIANELDANIAVNDLKEDVSLYEDGLGLDSISIVNLIVLIENGFNIKFDEDQINSKMFGSIISLASAISEKTREQV